MNVRLKLQLALAFLFAVLLLVGGVGIYYLNWLAADSRAIMQDNYRSLEYMQRLSRSLDRVQWILLDPDDQNDQLPGVLSAISEDIGRQRANITEPGERQLGEHLAGLFDDLQQTTAYQPLDSADFASYYGTQVLPTIRRMKEQIDQIYLINEEALLSKNQRADDTASKVTLYMAIVTAASLLIGLLYLLGLPAYIARPLRQLNDALTRIAAGNYGQQLPVDSDDEFGELARSFNTMATRLAEYEQSSYARILFEKKRLDSVINQLHQPVIGLDAERNILFANAHALRLLDLPRRDIVGRYAPDLATTNHLLRHLISGLMTFPPATVGTEEPQAVKIVEDGEEKLYTFTIAPVIDHPAKAGREVLLGHVILLTDVTEFAERDLAKTQFMGVLSHELKTPVAAIAMSVQLLDEDQEGNPLSREQQELLGTINGNVDRIRRIITELLEMSRLETGRIELTMLETDPEGILYQAVDGVRLFLQEKQLSISQSVEEDLPSVYVDPHKIVWVLNNFLTNAIRYAPFGSDIKVEARRRDGGVEIAVHDQGAGISPENQARIFRKFNRVRGDHTEGSGLGLAISKEFVEAMGGAIGVDSAIGRGSRFWMRFPTGIRQPQRRRT